jgi:uncharacterized protein (DUF2141 family)
MIGALALLAAATVAVRSTPDLGKAEGRCRPGEAGPAFLVAIDGLKDRAGRLKLELYPATDGDFLQDDNILVAAHKPFRRVEIDVPQHGPVELCIRSPGPGRYALSVLHDRNANRRFDLSIDGVGFSRNPSLGWSKPKAEAVAVQGSSGMTRIAIVMAYRRGLVSFRPVAG